MGAEIVVEQEEQESMFELYNGLTSSHSLSADILWWSTQTL